jgi:hypothetical protein
MKSTILFLVSVLSMCTIDVDAFFSSSFSRVARVNSLHMADYKLRVINKKKKTDKEITVPSNKFILDSAESQQVHLFLLFSLSLSLYLRSV